MEDFLFCSNAKNHTCNTPKIFLAFKLKDFPALTLLEPHITSAIEFEMEDFAVCKASLPYPSLVRRNSTLFRFEKEGTKRRFSVGKVFSPQCRKNCSHCSLSSFWSKNATLQQTVGKWVHFRQQQSGHPEVCSETTLDHENHFSPTLFFVRPSHLLCMQSTWARARTEFWSWDSVEGSGQSKTLEDFCFGKA